MRTLPVVETMAALLKSAVTHSTTPVTLPVTDPSQTASNGAGGARRLLASSWEHMDLPVRFADQFAVWDFGQDVFTARQQ